MSSAPQDVLSGVPAPGVSDGRAISGKGQLLERAEPPDLEHLAVSPGTPRSGGTDEQARSDLQPSAPSVRSKRANGPEVEARGPRGAERHLAGAFTGPACVFHLGSGRGSGRPSASRVGVESQHEPLLQNRPLNSV